MSATSIVFSRCFAAFLAMTGACVAEPVKDEPTGLIINPPAGYSVRKISGSRDEARFTVRKAEDGEAAGCDLQFAQGYLGSTGFAQPFINAYRKKKGVIDMYAASLRQGRSTVVSADYFTHGPIVGFAFVMDHPATGNQRSLRVNLENPSLEMTMTCTDDAARFAARRAEFEAVARGVTFPASK